MIQQLLVDKNKNVLGEIVNLQGRFVVLTENFDSTWKSGHIYDPRTLLCQSCGLDMREVALYRISCSIAQRLNLIQASSTFSMSIQIGQFETAYFQSPNSTPSVPPERLHY
jgi:hypothetical protein